MRRSARRFRRERGTLGTMFFFHLEPQRCRSVREIRRVGTLRVMAHSHANPRPSLGPGVIVAKVDAVKVGNQIFHRGARLIAMAEVVVAAEGQKPKRVALPRAIAQPRLVVPVPEPNLRDGARPAPDTRNAPRSARRRARRRRATRAAPPRRRGAGSPRPARPGVGSRVWPATTAPADPP